MHPLFHNQIVNPIIRKVATDVAAIGIAKERAAPEAFAYLEGLKPRAFLAGDSLSIADLAVMSNLVMYHYLGSSIDPGFAALNADFRSQLDAPWLRAALAEEKPFAEQMGLDTSFAQDW